jgi:diacylglycerol O-acyltransferase
VTPRAHEPVSAVDGAWLRMDQPSNPMVITAALRFEGALDHAALERLIEERLLPHGRFRQRVEAGALPVLPAHWRDDPGFDLRSHVQRVALPAPGGDAELRRFIDDRMSAGLDRGRPLWQLIHVEGAASGSTLVVRVHHAIGDGIALVRLLLSLTDEVGASPPDEVGVLPQRARAPLALARELGEQALTLGRLLLLPADPPSALKGPLGSRKGCAWSCALPLEPLKAAARARGAKLNDVLMACVTGALRQQLLPRGPLPSRLRALVPVYVKGASDAELGNHFGLVFVPLPIQLEEPEERVVAVKAEMDSLKGAQDTLVSLGVLGAMGVASEEIERVGIDLFTGKATLLVTNVPGPPAPLHLAGRRLADLLVWAPVSGHVGLGVSLLSYAGSLRMGVYADAHLVENPAAIVEAFEREVRVLCADS